MIAHSMNLRKRPCLKLIVEGTTVLTVQVWLAVRGEDILTNAFQQLDHDNDGYVSPEDLIGFGNLKELPMDASMLHKLWPHHEHHSMGGMSLAEVSILHQLHVADLTPPSMEDTKKRELRGKHPASVVIACYCCGRCHRLTDKGDHAFDFGCTDAS